MQSIDAVFRVIDVLEELSLPYMMVGSFATNLYARARSTEDADFVVELKAGDAQRIADRLGPSLRLDPQMSFETITMTTRNIIEVIDSAFSIELFHLRDDPYDQARFSRRRAAMIGSRIVRVATVEDVLVTKLRWLLLGGRHKDRDDIEAVLQFYTNPIDWPYIESWADRHGTRELLAVIRASVPKV